jgi:hypothetical protein
VATNAASVMASMRIWRSAVSSIYRVVPKPMLTLELRGGRPGNG